MSSEAKCPFAAMHGARTHAGAQSNSDWWPNRLNLQILHQHSAKSNPMGEQFDYAEEFKKLDLAALKKDLYALMTDSQDWWPADWGHYGGLFIRMAWHSAGTYRMSDGRGGGGTGNQRFAPINSWPDNGNLDKARRLLWPIKKKYGNKISWADLMILAGNCALESMGFKTFGFGGGRADIWEPEDDVYWGAEDQWLATSDKPKSRYTGERELENPLAAVQMGLIYVNPEGPDGNPDPVASGRDVRETFARMAMNDEETVALVAGGHTFGKAHGAGDPALVGPAPEGAAIEEMGFGWKNAFGTGKGVHSTTSGIEGAWKPNPTKWDMGYFDMLFGYEWELTKSPAGAHQWVAKNVKPEHMIPDAHDPSKTHPPMMTTADLSLRFDPAYEKDLAPLPQGPAGVRRRFRPRLVQADPPRHGTAGPLPRARGPAEELIGRTPSRRWITNWLTRRTSRAESQAARLGPVDPAAGDHGVGLGGDVPRLGQRGGANGARIRLAPQKDWEANQPAELAKVLQKLEGIQTAFNGGQPGKKKVSLADLIVLGGCAAVEAAAKAAGHEVKVPFSPGRTDASQAQTDVESFALLEPIADGFRNYLRAGVKTPAEELLLDRAQLLTLTAPEMTVLVGGLRAMDANSGSPARRAHRARRGTDERFLRQPARHECGVEALVDRRGLRRTGPPRAGQVDGHPGRSGVWLELRAAGDGRGLCLR